MTQASQARVEKLVGKKKAQQAAGKPHQSKSFDQLVSEATLARLRPYIQEQVGMAAERMAQVILKQVLSEKAMLQTRQLAFERLLNANTTWFNEEVLALAVADVEDEAAGVAVVDDVVKQGDKVRVEYQAKPNDKGDWTLPQKLAIHQVMVKGPQGFVQSNSEEFETALLGLKAGETREILIPETAEEGKEPEHSRISVKVIRVSRVMAAPATEQPATTEQNNG